VIIAALCADGHAWSARQVTETYVERLGEKLPLVGRPDLDENGQVIQDGKTMKTRAVDRLISYVRTMLYEMCRHEAATKRGDDLYEIHPFVRDSRHRANPVRLYELLGTSLLDAPNKNTQTGVDLSSVYAAIQVSRTPETGEATLSDIIAALSKVFKSDEEILKSAKLATAFKSVEDAKRNTVRVICKQLHQAKHIQSARTEWIYRANAD